MPSKNSRLKKKIPQFLFCVISKKKSSLSMKENLLIHSDNLKGLRYLRDEKKLVGKVDLVYINPPFATGGNFTITDGRASTISNSRDGEVAYSDTLAGADFIQFLKERLWIIRDLLSDKGSIYLHIDYKIGHYVKVMMDEVFGIENFRNDITRIKCNPKNFKRVGYGNIKDLILFYSKTNNPIWNEPKEKYSQEDLVRLFSKKNKEGRRYTTVPIHAPGETKNGKSNEAFRGKLPPKGRHWRTDVETLEAWDATGLIEWSRSGNPRKIIFADEQEGKRVQDIWEFKEPQYPSYPTEKNPKLLRRIIKTSSQENSLVLDCFCGSGTTLKAAQDLGRTWLGIDQSPHAIKATQDKLQAAQQENLFAAPVSYSFLNLKEDVNA